MESTEKSKLKKLPRPEIHLISWVTPAPFMMAKEVGMEARTVLSIVSNFRAHGCNLYKLCSNRNIERMLGLNYDQWMRIKRQLRDAGLVDYDGNVGDLSSIVKRWEDMTGQTWEYEL